MRILAGIAVMLLPAMAWAAPEIKERKDWRYCSEDAQCVLIEGTCAKTSVNMKAKNAATAFYREQAKRTNCAPPPFWKPAGKKVVARCRLGGCETILKQPAEDAATK
ncbi:MAG: hypothetical protein ACOYNL_10875 [Rickettsiales bacterium]